MRLSSRKKHKAGRVARMLKVLSNPTRLMICCLLKDRELFAQEILMSLGTTKGNISQHIKLLILHDVIDFRKEGARIYYRVKDPRLATLITQLETMYCGGKP